MMFRNLIATGALLLAGTATASPPSPGTLVSDTTFTTARGQSLKMGDLRGNVVVLTYWMRDCEACDAQVKMLDFYGRQRGNLGLQILAIPVEELSDRQLSDAFKDKRVFPLSRIRGPFEPLGKLPTTYVIDRYGQVRFAESGLLDIERLNQLLIPLLRQPQP